MRKFIVGKIYSRERARDVAGKPFALKKKKKKACDL